ncbi:MAG: hypothetical protein MSG64_07855 [Pyrinomonadaceae bacterium MAG19_C2-C3]|nr:hypothetical protein [Pyrinomonadaceae bacterium MAG19_C2-C3]
MNSFLRYQISFVLLFALSLSAFAQTAKVAVKPPVVIDTAVTSPKLFPLGEVRAGMKGIARTVFSGSEPEDFGVEILGVLPGYPGAGQSAIIAKLSGANVERTGVFAGMSGSPVFIDGRIVGAIAFAFPFAKEPIAGITPIAEMVDIFQRGTSFKPNLAFEKSLNKSKRDAPRRVAMSEIIADETGLSTNAGEGIALSNKSEHVSTSSTMMQTFSGQQLIRIATPVSFNGIKPETLARFTTQLQASNLLPIGGVGGAANLTSMERATAKTLLPGTSVSVQLVRGDFSIAAAGTVTMRDGEKIYAFGHPFLGLGNLSMPMTEASVVTVIPNALNSFKLAIPGALVGSIEQDRATGIYGTLGTQPRMIPIKVNVRAGNAGDVGDRRTDLTANMREYRFEVAEDEVLTPLLTNLALTSALEATERTFGNATIAVRGRIAVEEGSQDKQAAPKQYHIALERKFSATTASLQAAGAIAAPLSVVMTSGFQGARVKGVEVEIIAEEGRRVRALERLSVNRIDVRPGENVEVQATLRGTDGRETTERFAVEIPADTTPGNLTLTIGDAATMQQFAALTIVPRNVGELVEFINKARGGNVLRVRLARTVSGAIIGANELPNLPPSVLATLMTDRASGGVTTVSSGTISEDERTVDYVARGSQSVTLTVRR